MQMSDSPDPGSPAVAGVTVQAADDRPPALRRPAPGRLYPWLRRASWVESGIFAALILFWLAPGFDSETMAFGWIHGISYLGLLLFIFVAVVRHEVPFWLLAATCTPVGPFGSVIGIAALDRRRARRAGEQTGIAEPPAT
jgi:hypothetical protein